MLENWHSLSSLPGLPPPSSHRQKKVEAFLIDSSSYSCNTVLVRRARKFDPDLTQDQEMSLTT
eukprot:7752090-Pyramimonas_sp.AAC.1